jgi:hypothetical protein|tara:strand:+ start:175 stop:390 length:216 start_codon:yes stop_codon:yes gene_type:complete
MKIDISDEFYQKVEEALDGLVELGYPDRSLGEYLIGMLSEIRKRMFGVLGITPLAKIEPIVCFSSPSWCGW